LAALAAAGVAIVAHLDAVEVPRAKSGIAAAIESARAQIATLRADQHQVRSAPLLSGVVRERVREQIAALAQRGVVDVLPVIEAGRPLAFPMMDVRAEVSGHAISADGANRLSAFALHTGPDTLAIFSWLFQNELLDRLDVEITELADDENALSDAERAERQAALAAELLQAERIEEALLVAAEAEGLQAMRRRDADPRAVLGLASSLPARR
jgi:hypothetical protein